MNRYLHPMVCALGLVAALPGESLAADPGAAIAPAQITVSGRGEVSVPPSTATFSIGVNTRAPTAAAAGELNARLSKDVLAALERAGLPRQDVKRSQLSVNRRWDYNANGQRTKASAFEATNTIEIETHRLDQVGVVIDAALGAGATSASDVGFRAYDIDAARHRALSQAVAAARGDAEALARAAGGTLGELLLLSTGPVSDYAGVPLAEMAVAAAPRVAPPPVPTTVLPGDITVDASVNGRWRFVPQTTSR